MDRNRSGSLLSNWLASHAAGSTLSFTAIVSVLRSWYRYPKDHAVAVFISRRHACYQPKLVHHLRGR
ncbi:hypothetical protein, partial [Herbidospora mongoliensis]|uniref:hypothetical protein n=1 Tax=Herbidospora mongoliensis TaxID=688067 RepID=UPI001C3F3905